MHRWLLVAFSLWMAWAIRAHDILKMPAFVDESLHIMRAQVVFEFTDARASFLPAKLLTYYYLGLFDPQDHNGLWISRQAIALLTPLSAALCFALVRTFTGSFKSSLLVIWLYALTPFLVFFERLALSDPFVAVFALSTVLASIHFARQPDTKRAVIVGVLLGLAILAKLTALPLTAIPLLALWLLSPDQEGGLRFSSDNSAGKQKSNENLRTRPYESTHFLQKIRQPVNLIWQQRRWLFIIYTVTGLLLLAPVACTIYQELSVQNRPEVVESNLFVPTERSRMDQIGHNLETYMVALSRLTHPIFFLFVLMMIIAGLRQKPRQIFYLLLTIGVTWGFLLVTSAFPSTRYLAITFALVLVLIASLFQMMPPDTRRSIKLAVPIWIPVLLIYYAVWVVRLHDDPTQLKYGDQDYWEYFTNSSSGFALRDAAPDILELPHDSNIRLAAFVGNCHSLRLYFPEHHNVDLNCPYFRFNETMIPEVTAQWEQRVREDGAWYFLVEDLHLIDFSSMAIASELINTYDRPGEDGTRVWLYRVTPAERGSDDWFK